MVSSVRTHLHALGLRLPNRVRVELGTQAELGRIGAHLSGYTVTDHHWGAPATVVEIRILAGMPATGFGHVLAHEMAHGWLAGCPGERNQRDEEGLCELVASWWLRHRGGALAAHLLASMELNPDPVYGDGFRRARARSAGRTPEQVVAHVAKWGALPALPGAK